MIINGKLVIRIEGLFYGPLELNLEGEPISPVTGAKVTGHTSLGKKTLTLTPEGIETARVFFQNLSLELRGMQNVAVK